MLDSKTDFEGGAFESSRRRQHTTKVADANEAALVEAQSGAGDPLGSPQ
jgi:hypothetical protein